MVQSRKKVASVLALSVGAVLLLRLNPSQKSSPPESPKLVLPKTASRSVYPYSVIAGGAHSPAELRNVLLHDPIAAKHYAGFDLQATRVIRADQQRNVYVSYRIGERIYWTRKRVRVPKGETLLTDGTNIARTRCGNRISETPQSQTSPSEPSETALNTETVKPADQLPIPPDAQPTETKLANHTRLADNTRSADSKLHETGAATVPPGDYLTQFGPSQFNGSQTAPSGGGLTGSPTGAAPAGGAASPGQTTAASGIPGGGGGTGFGPASPFVPIQGIPIQGSPEWDQTTSLTTFPAWPSAPSTSGSAFGVTLSTVAFPAVAYPNFLPVDSGLPIGSVPIGRQPVIAMLPGSPASNPSSPFAPENNSFSSGPANTTMQGVIYQTNTDQLGPKPTVQDVRTPEPDTLFLTLGAAVVSFTLYRLRRTSLDLHDAEADRITPAL